MYKRLGLDGRVLVFHFVDILLLFIAGTVMNVDAPTQQFKDLTHWGMNIMAVQVVHGYTRLRAN